MVKYNAYIQMKSVNEMLKTRGLEERGRIQKYIDKEAIRIMTPYTPKDTSALIQSATRLTDIGSGLVKQGGKSAPYARKWYYTQAKFTGAPMRGTYWFKRAMQNGGAKTILKGVKDML